MLQRRRTASGYIKLDAMENPYQLPRRTCAQELGQRLADAALNRYPVPSYATLKQRIRDKLGVPAGYDVILGNGSDEIISHPAPSPRARQDKRAVVLAADPGLRDVPALGPVRRHGFRRRAA